MPSLLEAFTGNKKLARSAWLALCLFSPLPRINAVNPSTKKTQARMRRGICICKAHEHGSAQLIHRQACSYLLETHCCAKLKLQQRRENYSLYPNPARNTVTVAIDGVFCSDCYIAIYDLTGRQVMKTKLPEARQKVDVNIANIEGGMYIVNIGNSSSNIYNTRLSVIK